MATQTACFFSMRSLVAQQSVDCWTGSLNIAFAARKRESEKASKGATTRRYGLDGSGPGFISHIPMIRSAKNGLHTHAGGNQSVWTTNRALLVRGALYFIESFVDALSVASGQVRLRFCSGKRCRGIEEWG